MHNGDDYLHYALGHSRVTKYVPPPIILSTQRVKCGVGNNGRVILITLYYSITPRLTMMSLPNIALIIYCGSARCVETQLINNKDKFLK